MRRRERQSGLWVEAMGWPERLAWLLGSLGGSSVMIAGPYEIALGIQGKVIFAAIFLLVFWGAAYFRAKFLNEIADTPEHHLRFFNPEFNRDVVVQSGAPHLCAVQFKIYLKNNFDRPINYLYEVFDSEFEGFVLPFPDALPITLGPDLTSGRHGGRIEINPPISKSNLSGRLRWRVIYWTNPKRKFVLTGAMKFSATFNVETGVISNMNWSWESYENFDELK